MALFCRVVYRPRGMTETGISRGPAQPALGPLLFLACLWAWAIWSCAEHWEGNPNYSYGWVVPALAIGFALRRYLRVPANPASDGPPQLRWPAVVLVAAVLGVVAFALEYSREQVWHPVVVIWSIAMI